VLNDGLTCSILESWSAEAFDRRNRFVIGREEIYAQDEITDQRNTLACRFRA